MSVSSSSSGLSVSCQLAAQRHRQRAAVRAALQHVSADQVSLMKAVQAGKVKQAHPATAAKLP